MILKYLVALVKRWNARTFWNRSLVQKTLTFVLFWYLMLGGRDILVAGQLHYFLFRAVLVNLTFLTH